MARKGSPELPPGVVPPEPMSIGEVADPPFAVLPDPATLFLERARRFEARAEGHMIGDYLRFLSLVARAQHEIQAALATPALPPAEHLALARENAMPPLAVGRFDHGPAAAAVLVALAERLRTETLPAPARAAVERLLAVDAAARSEMAMAVLLDEIPADAVAEHVLAAAALQVHLTRHAALLDVETLQKVADGACPACGSAPVSSSVVGWEGAHGTRFCCCSLCATQWNVVRIRCLVCGNEKGIAYQSIEGGTDTVCAETCDSCNSYVKMFHRHKNSALEPLVDDVASLDLDMVLREAGWQRASVDPFLSGY
jgi:FdhE protein